MRISDWSSDVCSSDLGGWGARRCLAIPGTFERKTAMRLRTIMLAGMGAIVLTACAKQEEVAAVPPPPPGAVAGSIAADRDGDGIVDGSYTTDGMYHAKAVSLPPPPPPPAPSGGGERSRAFRFGARGQTEGRRAGKREG